MAAGEGGECTWEPISHAPPLSFRPQCMGLYVRFVYAMQSLQFHRSFSAGVSDYAF